ncbi:MAG: flagellar basal body rod protein FlgC [Vulcanimicrobiota bacterium]
MKFFQTFDIAASGMRAEQFRMDVVSNNIANANTSKTEDGDPYRRQVAVINAKQAEMFDQAFTTASMDGEFDFNNKVNFSGGGVGVNGIMEDNSDFRWVYDPTNPNAEKEGDRKGYVAMPNVNIIQEMTSMMAASRAYEANATTIESAKAMAMKALEIGKG